MLFEISLVLFMYVFFTAIAHSYKLSFKNVVAEFSGRAKVYYWGLLLLLGFLKQIPP